MRNTYMVRSFHDYSIIWQNYKLIIYHILYGILILSKEIYIHTHTHTHTHK